MGAFHKVAMTIGVTAISVGAAFRLVRIAAEDPAYAFVLGAGLGVLLLVELLWLVVMWLPEPPAAAPCAVCAGQIDVRCQGCGHQCKYHELCWREEHNGAKYLRCPKCGTNGFIRITP